MATVKLSQTSWTTASAAKKKQMTTKLMCLKCIHWGVSKVALITLTSIIMNRMYHKLPGGRESSAWSRSAANQCWDRLTSSGCTKFKRLSPLNSKSPKSSSSLSGDTLEDAGLELVLKQPGAEPFPIIATIYTWSKYVSHRSDQKLYIYI
jgi:hypothetical protein